MILRNWINKIIGQDNANNAAGITLKTTAGGIIVDTLAINANINVYADTYDETSVNYQSGNWGYGIAIGSGNTNPTVNDYKMESAITSNLNAGGVARSLNANTASSTIILTQPIVNLGSNNITVNEVGVFASYGGGYANILLSRDIIEPITIAPNETKTFVVTIDFAQMSTNVATS